MTLRSSVSLHQYRGHVQVSAPAVEPVTAEELRTHLRETATGLPDAEANDLIAEAREYAETLIGFAMITQTWLLALDRWPTQNEPWWDGVREMSVTELYGPKYAADVHLPRWPLQSIDGVNVYGEDGSATAVTVADVFDVDTYQHPGRMTLQRGATWPIALRANNAIEITYIAGYGSAASNVPAPLRRAVKNLAAHLYTHRGDGCEGAAIESGAKAILDSYKVARL